MSIQIVTDSTADDPKHPEGKTLPASPFTRQNVVRLSYHLGLHEYLDGDHTPEQYRALLAESNHWPTTAAPAPMKFETVFAEITDRGDSALCIPVSHGMSRTYQSALTAAERFGDRVRVVKTHAISIGLYFLADYASNLIKTGLPLAEVAVLVQERDAHIRTVMSPRTLENLKRGGRLSTAQQLVASALNLVPMIEIGPEDGVLRAIHKSHTWKRAKEELLKCALDTPHIKQIGVMYAGNLEEALEAAAFLKSKLGVETYVCDVGRVVRTHTGEGAFGLVIDTGLDWL